ncbi:MAG: hypothetical protein IKH34_02000 [Oscillospiraceae bacterium]|nr:hypothetical protein [Oscillospiraceae bacterium]
MFLKLTKQFGKPICALLFGIFGLMAGRKKPLPLLALLGMHTAEFFLVGRKTAEERGLPRAEGLAKCLAFGFTWWLPLKKEG